MNGGTKSLIGLIQRDGLLQVPGAYDALTAKIIEAQGFDAVYMTGYGTAASAGLPDLGLLTMTEMVQNAGRIVQAVEIPVISDADTGYGNEVNVARTVREFERAGISAIHLEDQTWPKKCGHMEGKRVIETGEMVDKLKAAVDARSSSEFLIIARCDAIAVEGFDAAIDRAQAYADAGADVLFVEAPETHEQVEAIPKRLPDLPHLINLAPKTPDFSAEELQTLGYSLAIYPGICLVAALEACTEAVEELKRTGVRPNMEAWRTRFDEMNRFLGAGQTAPAKAED